MNYPIVRIPPPKRLKIKVTATDIRAGEQGEADTCAVALGVLHSVPTSEVAYTDAFVALDGDVYLSNRDVCYRYKGTKKLKAFIDRFDHKKSDCKPTTFMVQRVAE